jgi:hypothetical protein
VCYQSASILRVGLPWWSSFFFFWFFFGWQRSQSEESSGIILFSDTAPKMAHQNTIHLVSVVCIIGATAAFLWSNRKKNKRSNDLPGWIGLMSKELPCFDFVDDDSNRVVMDKTTIHKLRKDHFCASQSVSYSNSDPLLVVRGEGSKLFDENGVEYLDTRNNVGHVGHSHPKVVLAIAKQASAINTNTRYLHPNHVRLADKLLQKCPSPLKRVFFVNSGSEANDLALRLARAHTKNKQVIVVDHA